MSEIKVVMNVFGRGYSYFWKTVCIGLKIPKKPLVVKLVLLLSHLGASSVPFVQQFFHHLEIPLNIAKMKENTLKFP